MWDEDSKLVGTVDEEKTAREVEFVHMNTLLVK